MRPSRKGLSSPKFWGKLLLSATVFCLIAAILLVVGVSAYLAYKPITLSAPQLERLLRNALPNYRFIGGELQLSWLLGGRGAGVAVNGLEMVSADGDELYLEHVTFYPSWRAILGGEFELNGAILEDGRLLLKSPQLPTGGGGDEFDFLRIKNLAITFAYRGIAQKITITDLTLNDLTDGGGGDGKAVLSPSCDDGTTPGTITLDGELEPNLTRLTLGEFKPQNPTDGSLTPCFPNTEFMVGWQGLRAELVGEWANPNAVTLGGEEVLVLTPFLSSPINLDSASLTLTLDSDGGNRGKTIIEEFAVSSDGLEITADGEVAANDEATLAVRIGNIRFARLPDLWPEQLATNTRRWVVANIPKGSVGETVARLTVADVYGEAAITSLNGEMRFSDLEVSYLKPMPPLVKARGTVSFTADRFDITVGGGMVGGVKLEGAEVALFDLDKPMERATVKARVQSELSPLLELLSSPPIGGGDYLQLPHKKAEGRVKGELSLAFPLLQEMTVADLELLVKGSGEDLLLAEYLGDLPLTVTKAEATATGHRLRINGEANVADVAFSFALDDDYSSRKVAITAEPDAAQAAAIALPLGVSVGEWLKSGSVKTEFNWQQDNESGLRRGTFTADLENCEFAFSPLGINKPMGIAAELKGKINRIADGGLGGDFTFRQGEGVASAAVLLTEQRRVKGLTAIIENLNGNTFKLTAAREANGWLADLKGESWNAAALFEQFLLRDSAADSADYKFTLDLATLKLFADGNLDKATGKIVRSGGRWQVVDMAADVGEGELQFKINPDEDGQRYILLISNLGSFLESQGLTERVNGGTFEFFAATESPAAPINGTLSLRGFNIGDFPFFVRLLNLASLSGIGSFLGKPIKFDNLSAVVAIEDRLLKIKDGSATSDELVITFDGEINAANEDVILKGALVPSYAINSIINRVPILGDLLTGGQGGIIALDYEMSGKIKDPKVSSNPLSALTPGLVKRLFSIFSP